MSALAAPLTETTVHSARLLPPRRVKGLRCACEMPSWALEGRESRLDFWKMLEGLSIRLARDVIPVCPSITTRGGYLVARPYHLQLCRCSQSPPHQPCFRDTSKSRLQMAEEEDVDSALIPSLYKPPALLPIAQLKDQLLYTIETYPVTVVVGETGSGKIPT